MIVRGVLSVVVTAVVVATTGCSGPTEMPTQAGVREEILRALEAAQMNGASDQQIAVLEDAAETGEVTYAQLEELFVDIYDCFDDVGWTYSVQEPREVAPGSGIFTPNYVAFPPHGVSEAAAQELFDSCNNEHIDYAMAVYSSQPAAMEAMFEAWDTPQLRSCLESHGYTVEEDATAAEVNALVSADIAEHMNDEGFRMCVP